MLRGIMPLMRILGIESSCDETAAAVVETGVRGGVKLLSNVIASSVDLHAEYGGVVPEIAARSHLEHINPVIKKAMKDSKTSWKNIDAIAVTNRPGLGGSLLIGVMVAKTLSFLYKKPLYGVNHVLAHPYAAYISEATSQTGIFPTPTTPKFPVVALVASGGHSHLILFRGHTDYKVIGRTTDDAVGEAFDKVAKIIGLPYPGGPSVEAEAKDGDENKYKLPIAKTSHPYNFSFSGLKTAVLRQAQAEIGEDFRFPSHMIAPRLDSRQKADMAASFQLTALETLVKALERAIAEYSPATVVIAGGVAANKKLRELTANRLEKGVTYPDFKLCTDNAAMIAAFAHYQIAGGVKADHLMTLEAHSSSEV